jgi:ABC-2 type transport system permease protein
VSNATLLIARREITTRLQQKGYRIGFLVALAVVVIVCILPGVIGGGSSTTRYQVGLAVDAPTLPEILAKVTHATGDRVTVHHTSAAHARSEVRSGDWDAALLPGNRLVVQHADDDIVAIVRTALQADRTVERLLSAGLSTREIKAVLHAPPLRVMATASSGGQQRQAIAIIAIVALFTQLMMFTTWTAMGVVEEKSSRVVELVLSAVRPRQLLSGKLLGIGTVAAAQVLALGVAAVAVASVAGSISLPASAIWTLLVSFVGFLLGFTFFASLAAALGSTVSRQEDVSGVLTPVSLLIGVCYIFGFTAADSPGSTVARVISIAPPFSAISMPARIARGGVAPLDVVLAVVLLVAAAAGILAIAARIYRASILHSGTRVSLHRAWRGEAAADLA